MLQSRKIARNLRIDSTYLTNMGEIPKGLTYGYLLLLPFVYKRQFVLSRRSSQTKSQTIEEKLLCAFQTFPIGQNFYLLCQLAQNLGFSVEYPSINSSHYFPIIQDKKIIIGFASVPTISANMVGNWLKEREKAAFTSLDDFYKRNPVSREVLKSLVAARAFRDLHRSTTALEWMLDTYTSIIPQEERFVSSWAHKKINHLQLLENQWIINLADLPSHYQVATELPHLLNEEVAVLGRLISSISFRSTENKQVRWVVFSDEESTLYLGQIRNKMDNEWKIGQVYFLSGTVKGFRTQTWIQIQSARYLS